MLEQIKKIIAIGVSLVALSPVAIAQTQSGPSVVVGGDKCTNVNSLTCINSTSRSNNTIGKNGELDSDQSKSFVQEYRNGMDDSTEVDGIIRPTTYCTGPNGEIIPHREALRFFFFENSQTCMRDSELRECLAGALSGSATFTSCERFNDCSGPGYELAHGQSGMFSNSNRSASCASGQRQCNNGNLNGNPAFTFFGTCTPFASCTHQGVTIPHGGNRDFFRVAVANNCNSERTNVRCNDGTVSGPNLNYSQTSCRAPVSCTHQGVSIPNGGTANFFRVAQSTNCTAERTTVTCNDGTVTGSNLNYNQTSCSAPVGCTHQGVAMAHGSSRAFFRVNVSPDCAAEQTTVSCNNGTVTGSNLNYNQTSCSAPVGCTHQGVAMAHGTSRTFFRVNVSPNCAAEQTTVTCNNGTVSGANLNYNQTSCSAPVGCTHHGVAMAHASSRSFWRVNRSSNCANEQTNVTCNNGTVTGANLQYDQSSCSAPIMSQPQTVTSNSGVSGIYFKQGYFSAIQATVEIPSEFTFEPVVLDLFVTKLQQGVITDTEVTAPGRSGFFGTLPTPDAAMPIAAHPQTVIFASGSQSDRNVLYIFENRNGVFQLVQQFNALRSRGRAILRGDMNRAGNTFTIISSYDNLSVSGFNVEFEIVDVYKKQGTASAPWVLVSSTEVEPAISNTPRQDVHGMRFVKSDSTLAITFLSATDDGSPRDGDSNHVYRVEYWRLNANGSLTFDRQVILPDSYAKITHVSEDGERIAAVKVDAPNFGRANPHTAFIYERSYTGPITKVAIPISNFVAANTESGFSVTDLTGAYTTGIPNIYLVAAGSRVYNPNTFAMDPRSKFFVVTTNDPSRPPIRTLKEGSVDILDASFLFDPISPEGQYLSTFDPRNQRKKIHKLYE